MENTKVQFIELWLNLLTDPDFTHVFKRTCREAMANDPAFKALVFELVRDVTDGSFKAWQDFR